MGPLEAVGHVINLLLPGLGVAVASALAAKIAWRRELGAVSWWRLATAGAVAGTLALMVSLVVLGKDGSIAGYASMVCACAVSQWWRGFGPGRH